MDLNGKRALILGASRGIGLAIARLFNQYGLRLILPWFDWPESATSLEKEFRPKENGHLIWQGDLRESEAVSELFGRIREEIGGLDILINNIERGGMPVVHGAYHKEINQNQWQLEMETTLYAKWLVFDQALPLLKQNREAAVVNISSIAGIIGRSGPVGRLFNDGYAAANRGVSLLTETWARLGAPTVRVNEIMLGLIDSRHGSGTKGWNLLSAQEQEEIISHILLQRTGKPEEVAQVVLFLVRDASYLTGSVLRMDGGYILGGEIPPPMPEGVL